MKSIVTWLWERGVVSTFLAGLFALLPVVVTAAVAVWLARNVYELLGPQTAIGSALREVGLRVVTHEAAAVVIGWAVVLLAIWLVGLMARTRARRAADAVVGFVMNRIPFVRVVYRTANQAIGMMNREDRGNLEGMSVVFCDFGGRHGVGFLALLASPEVFRFGDRDCRVVYIPTSPLPMSGGILFAPVESVQKVNMSVDQLMQIYFSLGVLTPQAVPGAYRAPEPVGPPGGAPA